MPVVKTLSPSGGASTWTGPSSYHPYTSSSSTAASTAFELAVVATSGSSSSDESSLVVGELSTLSVH